MRRLKIASMLVGLCISSIVLGGMVCNALTAASGR